MSAATHAIVEAHDVRLEQLHERVAELSHPVVFRGLVEHWPLVRQAQQSADAAADYLRQFDTGEPVTAYIGNADDDGRIFYNDNLTATNFQQTGMPLDQVLAMLGEHADNPRPPTIYVGSSAIDLCLPGLGTDNSLPRGRFRPSVRIWLGNRTTVAAHYDALENIACVCAGRRRFTLFPPDQLPNLYVGPMELTPAGQQISLVDLNHPDLDRYPRFSEALAHAQSAELEPGDAIYIPAMWWHHVQGLSSFNILINHWWREVPDHMGAPVDALLHAILNIRDLPLPQRQAWRDLFDHYVFNYSSDCVEHIPEHSRGALGTLDETTARRLRTWLRNKLNR
ncbi:MAG: cupin-like domain-containing protein [Wenzhouxiangella sp.]|nr:MAG: cupin-like domain-containing protein [Wenzhouxiangella sp.]